MFQLKKTWGLGGLLAVSLLASCQKVRSVSTLFADLSIGLNEMPSNQDAQVKLTKIRYRALGENNQPVAKTGIFLKSGKGVYEIACADSKKNEQLLNTLGFNADYAQYLRVEEDANLVPTARLRCEQDPNTQVQFLFKYEKDGRIYHFVKDYDNNRVFLLGCQALVAGFGFTSSDWIEDGAFSELLPASNDKSLLFPISCLNGKKINPEALAFSEKTLDAVAQIKTGVAASSNFQIPLELADQNLQGTPRFLVENSADAPCDERLVWFKQLGSQGALVQGGTRPILKPITNKEADCALVVKAQHDGNESKPLRVDIKVSPKKLQKVFADNGTFCVATDIGEIVCKGDRKETFDAVGSAPISMIIDFNYICALYDPAKVEDNLKCKYASSIPERLTSLQPKGRISSVAGNQLFACAVAYDGKMEDKAQTLSCWKTSTAGESQTGIVPPSIPLQGNTVMASSQDLGVCWDSVDLTGRRLIECHGDREFANTLPSTDPEKQTIKDVINLGQLTTITDMQRAAQRGGGCVGYGEGKVKCWGALDTRLGEKLGSVTIKPGSLRVSGNRLCYQEPKGSNPSGDVVQCYDTVTGTGERSSPKADLTGFAVFRKLDRSIVRCDLAGKNPILSCGQDYVKQVGDIFPEGRYWTKLIAP